MNSHRTLITVMALLLSFATGSAFAQVAVDLQRPAKTTEDTEETPAPKKEKKRAPEEKPKKSLEEVMRPEEFKSAGLDKLSEDELQHLDAWLQGYRQVTEKKATQQAETKANEQIKKATEEANARAAKATKFEGTISRVDGSFEGLKGRTLIKLEDGTVWRQANADDRYRTTYTDHPNVSVVRTTFGYKMRVEGMPEFYVDPVHTD